LYKYLAHLINILNTKYEQVFNDNNTDKMIHLMYGRFKYNILLSILVKRANKKGKLGEKSEATI